MGRLITWASNKREAGDLDGSDAFVRFVTTSAAGSFSALLGGLGAYVARVDYTTLPNGECP
jgi:hypothetical protein